jgi:hypothetical protein
VVSLNRVSMMIGRYRARNGMGSALAFCRPASVHGFAGMTQMPYPALADQLVKAG